MLQAIINTEKCPAYKEHKGKKFKVVEMQGDMRIEFNHILRNVDIHTEDPRGSWVTLSIDNQYVVFRHLELDL